MRFPDCPDRTGMHPFDETMSIIVGMPLIAHLRNHIVLLSQFEQTPGLPDRPRERLLYIDMLAELHGHAGRHGMRVIRRRHDHSVDVIATLVQHPPEILVFDCLRELLEGSGSPVPIGIGQRHDILGFHIPEILICNAAGAYACNVQEIAGRAIPHTAKNVPGHDSYSCRRQRGVPKKGAARKTPLFHDVSTMCVSKARDSGKAPNTPEIRSTEHPSSRLASDRIPAR